MTDLIRRNMMMATDVVPSDAIIVAKRSDNEAALMEVIYAQGWSKSPLYMTKSEAEKVTDIGTAFNNNTEITDFTAFEYFKQSAFNWSNQLSGMLNLSKVILPSSITSIIADGLSNTNVKLLKLPNSIITFYGRAFCRPSLREFVVDEHNQRFKSVDGILYDKNMTTLLYYPSMYELAEYTTPNSIVTINDFAFRLLKKENVNITLSEGVQTIGREAFFCANWETPVKFGSLTIPSTVTQISSTSCARGSGFTQINYHASIDIPGSTFMNCAYLETFIIYATGRIIKIATDTFRNTVLSNVYVPDDLLDEYKAADVWSTYADRIKPLSEYTQ